MLLISGPEGDCLCLRSCSSRQVGGNDPRCGTAPLPPGEVRGAMVMLRGG